MQIKHIHVINLSCKFANIYANTNFEICQHWLKVSVDHFQCFQYKYIIMRSHFLDYYWRKILFWHNGCNTAWLITHYSNGNPLHKVKNCLNLWLDSTKVWLKWFLKFLLDEICHSYLPRHSSANGYSWCRAEQTHIDTWRGECGLLRHHSNVTAGNKLATCRCGNTVHHGNHRNRYVLYYRHYLENICICKNCWLNRICDNINSAETMNWSITHAFLVYLNQWVYLSLSIHQY